MSNSTQLADLLCELFDAAELRRYLAHGPDGKSLVDSLRNDASLVELSHEAANALARRSSVTDAFFESLSKERPNCRAKIMAVREDWFRRTGSPMMASLRDRRVEPTRPAPSGATVRFRRAAFASIAFHVGLALQPSFGMPVVLLLFLTLPSVRVLFDREAHRWIALVHWIWVGLWLLPSGVALKEMVKLKVDELDSQVVVLFAAIIIGLYANIAYLRSPR